MNTHVLRSFTSRGASLLIVPAMAIASVKAQNRTVYEPSASDPRIVGALDAERRLERAGQPPIDIAAMADLFAPDLVVHSPINKVVDRESVLTRMRNGQIAYEPNATRTIEYVGVHGDLVVVMGEEVVKPTGDAPNAGQTVHRRSTDIWKAVNGAWKLVIRQATVTSVQ
jgi:ketosteroid isomerase-like protein